MNVILMGLRGSGKSTLARALSRATGLACVDLDELTASLLGSPNVAEAWRTRGEQAFRLAETRALTQALGDLTPIIALGGGTPTAPGAADLLRAAKRSHPPRLVYLRGSPGLLGARLLRSTSGTRPSLTGAAPADEVPVVFAQRDPLYRSLADHVLEIDDLGPDDSLAKLLAILGQP